MVCSLEKTIFQSRVWRVSSWEDPWRRTLTTKRDTYFSTLSSRLSRHWIAWALSSSTRWYWYHIACTHGSSWMPLYWILVLAFKTSHMGGKHRLGRSELPETFALISRQKPRRTGTRTLAYGSPAQWPELACFQRLMYCRDASSVCATGHRITGQQLPFNVTPLLLKNNPNWKESGYWVEELLFFFFLYEEQLNSPSRTFHKQYYKLSFYFLSIAKTGGGAHCNYESNFKVNKLNLC